MEFILCCPSHFAILENKMDVTYLFRRHFLVKILMLVKLSKSESVIIYDSIHTAW